MSKNKKEITSDCPPACFGLCDSLECRILKEIQHLGTAQPDHLARQLLEDGEERADFDKSVWQLLTEDKIEQRNGWLRITGT